MAPNQAENRFQVTADPFLASKVFFEALPTQMSFTEYSYDSTAQELKVHIWLLDTPHTLRYMWEHLAEAFGVESLNWTADAEAMVPFSPYKLTGSIFIGLKANQQQAINVIKHVIELDHKLVSLRTQI